MFLGSEFMTWHEDGMKLEGYFKDSFSMTDQAQIFLEVLLLMAEIRLTS